MNKLIFLTTFICGIYALQSVKAQDLVTTLQHAGTTKVFYGTTSFSDAYTASVTGDTIYLSPGGFTPPSTFTKGLTVIGAGHFPDSTTVKRRTTVFNNIVLGSGSDNFYLEGLYLTSSFGYSSSTAINNVTIKRCRLSSLSFNKLFSNWTIDECVISDYLVFQSLANPITIKHCILNGQIQGIGANANIDGNIFLRTSNTFYGVSGSIFKNNIFIGSNMFESGGGGGDTDVFYNNLFVLSSATFTSQICSGSSNYFSIPQANVFVNQSGNTFDYSHNYHLKSPTTYIGTDGTQVGLYGGLIPFKDGGVPSNPQITSKSVDTKTDANGNLKINFTVKAQDN